MIRLDKIQAVSVSVAAIALVFFVCASGVRADTRSQKAAMVISPQTGTVLAGSTFDVSVFLDTQGASVNAVELNLVFPPDKLQIIRPSGGKSFFSIWPEPPMYSNTEGTARFVGGVPNGITTANGLVTTLTFKAIAQGSAAVEVADSSKAFANDGLATNILSGYGRGVYAITAKPPEGVRVFSQTHPFEDRWYNNASPVITWDKDSGVEDFSVELDEKPSTIPDNRPDTADGIRAYQNIGNGVWYFHIKARRGGVWGSTTHFALRIDTEPPAPFVPKIEVLNAALTSRALVSFVAEDFLSGIDHYEVGLIDKTASVLQAPAFVQAPSPYQVPAFTLGNLHVIVRALDRAGTVRDQGVDIYVPWPFSAFVQDHANTLILSALFLVAVHYLFGHRIIARAKTAYTLLRKQEHAEESHSPEM